MNQTQFFAVMLVLIGFALLVVFPIFGIVAGKWVIALSVVGGWALVVIGAAIAVVSLVLERLGDLKAEKFDEKF